MNLLPSEEKSLRKRLDAYCKKVVVRRNYKLFIEEEKRRNEGCVFSDMDMYELEGFQIEDHYDVLDLWIIMKDLAISIENEMLHKTLEMLPEKRKEIILLSFFHGMTDAEIANKILMPTSTVQYNRNAALRYIKKMMEGDK